MLCKVSYRFRGSLGSNDPASLRGLGVNEVSDDWSKHNFRKLGVFKARNAEPCCGIIGAT
jgi:hypothetical protein